MRGPILIACVVLLSACGGTDDEAADPTTTPTQSASGSATPSPTGAPSITGPVAVIDTIATGLDVPWGMAFLPDGTALVAERNTARVLAIAPDHSTSEIAVIRDADPSGEGGLLGLAVSPDFATDRQVFAYVTTADDNRVVKFSYDPGGEQPTTDPVPVLTGLPKAGNHNGGRLLFDTSGNLLVATGDAGDSSRSQSTKSPGGKILRITPDGDPAPGNPIGGSPIWSLGHRNVQGLALDSGGRLWASEFGQNTWDELNLIAPGANYGWPVVEGKGDDPKYTNPVAVWKTSEASPSGLAYANGALWMGGLRGERLWRIPVDASGKAGKPVAYLQGDLGRIRTVITAPDGNLWITTSNRDGRGDPEKDDDKILVVRPGS